MWGTLYPELGEVDIYGNKVTKGSFFLSQYVGEATYGERTYSVSSILDGSIEVKSKQTGRTFVLRVSEAVEMAIEAGIDGNEPIENTYKKED